MKVEKIPMDRFDYQKTQNANPLIGTISDDLDRVDVKVSKIGMNSSEQALFILSKLDEISDRLRSVDNEQSRKVAETQFEGITTKIRKEASSFIRDLGGVAALRKAREQVRPPSVNWWWYLDEVVTERRQATFRRGMITLGATLVALLVLIGVYQAFLAPDPAVTARYAHEQSARDRMMEGELALALQEVEKGLEYDPQDPTLLIQRGVLLESLGRESEAQPSFLLADQGIENQEEFLVTRGQAYMLVNQMEKAMADVEEAVRLNPDFAQAYLLAGQINEMTQNYKQAMTDYEKAYAAADKSKQYELAALARTRTAMLLQMINAQIEFPTEEPTP